MYDNYFHKPQFYLTIVVYFNAWVSFFNFHSKDPVSVVWLPFLLTPTRCPFFVTWEILGVEMEDGRQS